MQHYHDLNQSTEHLLYACGFVVCPLRQYFKNSVSFTLPLKHSNWFLDNYSTFPNRIRRHTRCLQMTPIFEIRTSVVFFAMHEVNEIVISFARTIQFASIRNYIIQILLKMLISSRYFFNGNVKHQVKFVVVQKSKWYSFYFDLKKQKTKSFFLMAFKV